MRSPVLILIVCSSSIGPLAAQPDLDAGRRAYEVCAGCHGFVGEGNPAVHAPRLAGLEDWYLERQMNYFLDGVRGYAEDDPHGQRMAVMSRALRGERALADAIAYIRSLPPYAADRVAAARDSAGADDASGNAERGRELYMFCAACHGLSGEGNVAVGAPALAGLEPWYVAEQLRLYAEGLRGTHPEDVYGAQMRALAARFADDAARRDLAAHIATLGDD